MVSSLVTLPDPPQSPELNLRGKVRAIVWACGCVFDVCRTVGNNL